MQIKQYGEFKYIVADNFFDKEILKKLTEITLNSVVEDQITVHDVISNELKYECYENYGPILNEALELLAPNKVKLTKKWDLRMVQTGPRANYPMHQDHPNKLLSVVVYISPKKSTGTLLYKSKIDESPMEVQWVQNRAFIFSRNPHYSWHSYAGDGESVRRTVLFNIRTEDIRQHEIIDYGYIGYISERLKRIIKKFFGIKLELNQQ